MQDNSIIRIIKEDGLLPLFYNENKDISISICKALFKGGVSCIEYTNRGDNALDNFEALIKERNQNMPGLFIGVGTIKNANEAKSFINAGADFLISPFFDILVNEESVKAGLPYIPGCMTPGEIQLAISAGCTTIKLFPGNVLGPGFVEAIRPLFKNVNFIVTGGITLDRENISDWFTSGVSAIGIGSKLVANETFDTESLNKLCEKTNSILTLIKAIRK